MARMSKGGTPPAEVVRGFAPVPERLRRLDKTQRFAALATDGGGQPYISLVSFAVTEDLAGVVFATPRDTAKYANIRNNPRVSLLIDSRADAGLDIMQAEAVTIIGDALPVRRGRRRDVLAGVLTAKHPDLAKFVGAGTTALVLVGIKRAVHVAGFQTVTVWEAG